MLFNVPAQPSTRDRTVLSYDLPAWPKTIVWILLSTLKRAWYANEKGRKSTGNLSDQNHSARHEPTDLASAAGARESDPGAVARRAATGYGVGRLPHA